MVYVDNMNMPNSGWTMCHMMADTTEELLYMADKLEMSRAWIQKPGTKKEHFNISLSKKKLAIKFGAQEISVVELEYMVGSLEDDGDEPAELVAIVIRNKYNPDFKSNEDITARVNGITYRIPWYCLIDFLWGMPDDFYPCDKNEWADHPLYFTSIDMFRKAIEADEKKFKAFIIPL